MSDTLDRFAQFIGPPSGDAAPAVPARAPGSALGKYRILRKLGEGGMGIVYEAEDPSLDRRVALKVLKDGDASVVARLHREAAIVARLPHPHIVTVYDLGFADGAHFIAMEYVEGRTLAQALSEGGTSRRDLLRALETVARAVGHAHAQGVVHRDVKPHNVLFDKTGRAVLSDFGLARGPMFASRLTATDRVLGTPHYMAPEQISGGAKEADARADVYALGVMLYEIVAGRLPFAGTTPASLFRRILSDEPERPNCERDLEWVCLKAMSKEPGRRYADASEFADDLARWLAGELVRARPASLFYRLRRQIAKRRGLVAALAVTLVAASGTLGVFGARLRREHRAREASDHAMARVNEFLLAVATRSEQREELGLAAAAALDEALAIDGGTPALWVWLGRCRKLAGGDASPCWEKAAATGYGPAFFERGRYRLERYRRLRGDPRELHQWGRLRYVPLPSETAEAAALRRSGEADLQSARRAGVEPELAAYLEALAALGRGDYTVAESAVSRYLGRVGWESEAFLLRGQVRRFQRRHASARADLDRAIELDPTNAAALHQRAKLRTDVSDFAGAEEDYAALIRVDAAYPGLHLGRGTMRVKAGRSDEAESDFRSAVEREGTSRALSNLAYLCSTSGRMEEAETLLRRAVALDASDPLPHASLSTLLFERGDRQAGFASLDRAVALDPTSAFLRITRGLWRGGDDALADYDRAVELDPSLTAGWYQRARVHHAAGRVAQAEADYDRAAALEPSAEILWDRACFHHDAGHDAKALADYAKLLEIHPEPASVLNNRGGLHYKARRHAEAEADFTEAIARDSRFGQPYLNRGLARLAQGRRDEAIRDFERAMELDPRLEPLARERIAQARDP